jgi:hypothetical protein
MMMYQYKSEKDTTTMTTKVNQLNRTRNLAGMLEEAVKGTVNVDDLYLRKVRKMIRRATVS